MLFIPAIDVVDGRVDIIHWFLLALQHTIASMQSRCRLSRDSSRSARIIDAPFSCC
ncbi:hypothetical protein BGLA2_150010 [Burkholderia gladioli]|nr:hypothetical protein BGLA2_150010 [Burkholderia gladioli]